MDAKPRDKKPRPEVGDFLKKYEKFSMQLAILKQEFIGQSADSHELNMKSWQFKKVYEQPMDTAWKLLTAKEKEECLKQIHPRREFTGKE